MAQKSEMNDWIKKGVAIGLALISRRDRFKGMVDRAYDSESGFHFGEIKNSFKTFIRMVKSIFKGEYKDYSPWIFINTALGTLYLTLNIDLIPDSIGAVGVVDDVAVVLWVINTYAKEIEKFEAWEAGNMIKDIQFA